MLDSLAIEKYSSLSFPRSFIKDIIRSFNDYNQEELKKYSKIVGVAGRIIRKRNFGSLIFADLSDSTGIIQIKIQQNKSFLNSNIGDFIEVQGLMCKTDKGELSVELKSFNILVKCKKMFPNSYNKLSNWEERFRKRYLDFIVNEDKKEILVIRWKIIKNIKDYLDNLGYIEIETPILVAESSGAQAKPFITHHNKLQQSFFLRIATEISLKKLIVGGFEQIYELGRIFRNEGIDANHNPEFTTIEIYKAFQDSSYMMDLTKKLFDHIYSIIKPKKILFNNNEIDLSKPFEKYSMKEIVKKYTGVDFDLFKDLEQARLAAKQHDLNLQDFQNSIGLILLCFFENFVEKKIINPTFIYDFPIESSPLAKRSNKDSNYADRFELYISGQEFANGYSELNDYEEQKQRFINQLKQKNLGNEEIHELDQDFLEALSYGMPPAGGLGIGIDRMVMLFTSQNSIKEVIAFPQLKKL